MKKKYSNLLLLVGLILIGISQAHGERHALLVGISEYEDRSLFLEGPVYDVAALKQALMKQWEFPEKNIVTLVDGEATRPRVLDELAKLTDKTRPGDHVFFYFSGHGTSRKDEGHGIPLPHTSGALIPVDFPVQGSPEEQLQKMIVGRRDIRPQLTALDKGGRHVFVAIDSCYSGNAVRATFLTVVPNRFRLKPRFVKIMPPTSGRGLTRKRSQNTSDDPDLCGYRCGTKELEPYPYRNVFFLSAASDDETAEDISRANLHWVPTLDGEPHGAFSDALLRVLTGDLNADINGDGFLIYDEIRRSIRRFMTEERQYSHTPQVLPQINEDTQKLAQRQVFEYSGKIPFSADSADRADNKLVLRVQLVDKDNALADVLKKIEGVELVNENPEIAIKRQEKDMLLVSGAGDLIVRLENNPSADTLGQRIRQQVWIKKLLQAPTGKATFNITLDQLDSHRGVTAVEGEHVAFTVRSEKPAYLLLLVINSKGDVSVLYPYDESELNPALAGQVIQIPPGDPDDIIEVTEPFGTDQLIVYGFERMPPILRELMGQEKLASGSDLLTKLEKLLLEGEVNFARESLQLVTVPRQAPSL